MVGERPFQAGVDFPYGGKIIKALNGGCDIKPVQFQTDIGLRQDFESVVHHDNPSPDAVVEANVVEPVANIFLIGAV